MREHNRTAVVSRHRAALACALMALVAAGPALAQYDNTGSYGGYSGSSGYGSSRYGSSSSSSYGSSRYGSSSSRYSSSSSSYGSSRYGSSSSRYSSSSSANSLNSQYGSGSSTNSSSSRSSSRYSQSRNAKNTTSERSSKNTASGTTVNQADRARSGQQKVTTVTRKAATGKAAPKRASSGGGSTQATVPADYKSSALYFTPPVISVESGDRFDTQIVYFNRATEPIDELNLWVNYDPNAVEPVWVNTKSLDAMTTQPIEARVWREDGYVHINARIGRQIGNPVNELVEITWKAIAPSVESSLNMGAPQGRQQTGIYAGGRNILINNFFNDPASIKLSFQVDAKLQDDYNQADVNTLRESLSAVDLDPLKRVRLAVIPNKAGAAPGEVVTADVMLLNPGAVELDRIRLRLRYQPDVVQVLDADQDNYLTKGINIFDGDFHSRFPFDDLVANNVDLAAGTIDYEVGSFAGSKAYPGGTIARIVYRPLKPTTRAVFWFELVDPATGRRATDVQREGVSLLGDSSDIASAALHGATVKIQ